MIKLMYITNEPDIASLAQQVGIDRIFVDLEVLGKAERQSSIRSFITHHTIEDIQPIRDVLSEAELMVRVNPIHKGSQEEIESVLAHNPDVVMLPMFTSADEVRTFLSIVNGRAEVSLLLETSDAVESLDEILTLEGIDEIHVGLNDLHLTLNQSFLFEPVSSGMIESIARKVQASGIRFGFGGLGRLGQGLVPAEMVLTEHYRIQSEMVILSRAFREDRTFHELLENDWLHKQISLLREKERELQSMSEKDFADNFDRMSEIIQKIVEVRNAKSTVHGDS